MFLYSLLTPLIHYSLTHSPHPFTISHTSTFSPNRILPPPLITLLFLFHLSIFPTPFSSSLKFFLSRYTPHITSHTPLESSLHIHLHIPLASLSHPSHIPPHILLSHPPLTSSSHILSHPPLTTPSTHPHMPPHILPSQPPHNPLTHPFTYPLTSSPHALCSHPPLTPCST